jgi:hypothetical protein
LNAPNLQGSGLKKTLNKDSGFFVTRIEQDAGDSFPPRAFDFFDDQVDYCFYEEIEQFKICYWFDDATMFIEEIGKDYVEEIHAPDMARHVPVLWNLYKERADWFRTMKKNARLIK